MIGSDQSRRADSDLILSYTELFDAKKVGVSNLKNTGVNHNIVLFPASSRCFTVQSFSTEILLLYMYYCYMTGVYFYYV